MRNGRLTARLVIVGAILASASANVSEAHAVVTCDLAPAPGVTVTCTNASNLPVDLIVPAGVSSVRVVAVGGAGGADASGAVAGGSGARIESVVQVLPSITIRMWVGGGGGRGGGAGGAGGIGVRAGGNGDGNGGGGGGVTIVEVAGADTARAAGGGGAGAGGAGGSAGTNAGAGSNGSGAGAGAAGANGTSVGAAGTANGGGGGAGALGGLGGAVGGGGAGLSIGDGTPTFSAAGNAQAGAAGADGYVAITFIADPAPQESAPAASLPADVYQGVGMPVAGCTSVDRPDLNWAGVLGVGWSASWAQWMNSGSGGPVCIRVLRYDASAQAWRALPA